MFDITSPKPFTGKIGPVQFVQGKATTDHASVVAYCRRRGYTVVPVKEATPKPVEVPEETDVKDTPDTPETPEVEETPEGPKETTKRTRKGGTGGN